MKGMITQHISYADINSKDGVSIPIKYLSNILEVCLVIEKLVWLFNADLDVTSGYRSRAHNKVVKGSKNSFHMKGMAIDFSLEGIDLNLIYETLVALSIMGVIPLGGIHKYKTFIHYDIRGYSARW